MPRKTHVTLLSAMACALLVLVVCAPALAQSPTSTSVPGEFTLAFEDQLLARLATISPEAVPLFERATRDLVVDDYAAAKEGFQRVLELAPDFAAAWRRLSQAEVGLGERAMALDHARHALASEESPLNQAAVARALLGSTAQVDRSEALKRASGAHWALPDTGWITWVWFLASYVNDDIATLQEATPLVLALYPDDALPHYAAGVLAALDGSWQAAERELDRASALGMPAEDVNWAMDKYRVRQRARWARLLPTLRAAGRIVLEVWLAIPLTLVTLGLVCSWLTLAALRQPARALGSLGPGQSLLRGVYRATTTLAALYLYPSLVLLAFSAALVPTIISWSTVLETGQGLIPVLFGSFFWLWLVYTLLHVHDRFRLRGHAFLEIGVPLEHGIGPALWTLTNDMARLLDTAPLDEIRLLRNAEIVIVEEGTLRQRLRGRGRRVLLLGLGALAGLTQGDLRAILAHEFAHLAHGDTAGARLASQVIETLAHNRVSLGRLGWLRWLYPTYLLSRTGLVLLATITSGARRLEEGLADRAAAEACGPAACSRGLRAIVRQGVAFRLQWGEKGDLGDFVHWLPRLEALPAPPEEQVQELCQKELARRTVPYDLHLAPAERLELMEALDLPGPPAEPASPPAWDLLPDRLALQQLLTEPRPWRRSRAT
jgi:Zn-dependent protease with chaperone function